MSLQSNIAEFPRLLPRRADDIILAWMARLTGCVLLVLCAAVWLSLVTWSVSDPSLSHAIGGRPQNWLGPLGAVVSDLLLQTLGLAGAVAVIAPLWWGVALLRQQAITEWRTKLVFLAVAIFAIAASFGALPRPQTFVLQHGFGGFIGRGLYELLSGIVALVSPMFAGLAAGLTTAAVGGFALSRALGVGRAELVPAFYLDRAGALRGMPGFTHPAGHRFGTDGPAEPVLTPFSGSGSGAEPSGLSFGHASDDGLGGGSTSSFGHATDMTQSTTVAGGPDGLAEDDIPLPAFLKNAQAAAGGTEPPVADFDAVTDAKSLAIAARFRPAGAAALPDVGTDTASGPEVPTKTAPAAAPSKGVVRGNLLGGIRFGGAAGYRAPSLNLLARPSAAKPGPEFTQTVLRGSARLLEDVLGDFGVKGEIKEIKPGPVVTLFELEPARGTKSSRVIGLADDIARSMSAASARVAVVPGRNALGIELPNVRRETVYLRELLDSEAWRQCQATLPIALGKSIGGEPVIADLARMPHLLVAGTTGSGKSVGVNAMILSLIYRLSADQCRLLMIDPKMLELSVYNGIPHLLAPVVTDPAKAVAALNWAVSEMEERYKRMAELGVRNIDVYNNRLRNAQKRGEALTRTVQTGFDHQTGEPIFERQSLGQEPLPYIVVVVDEFADLMMVAGKDIEAAVQRLAQMARAAGIHLIMATQRPSVDVITGTIKANFPTRISFKVASKIDSRTILNEQGAEQLLGQGDMLFSNGGGGLTRIHGAFVSDDEVEGVAAALREHGPGQHIDLDVVAGPLPSTGEVGERNGADDLYEKAVAIVSRDRKASASYIQRRLSIGYNRAADLIERMERERLVSPANATGRREILFGSGAGGEAVHASRDD